MVFYVCFFAWRPSLRFDCLPSLGMPPRSVFVPIKPPWDRITIADEHSGKSHVQLTVTNTILTYGYGSIPINTIFRGMNIHLPAILMFTRGTRFWHIPIFWGNWPHWVFLKKLSNCAVFFCGSGCLIWAFLKMRDARTYSRLNPFTGRLIF